MALETLELACAEIPTLPDRSDAYQRQSPDYGAAISLRLNVEFRVRDS